MVLNVLNPFGEFLKKYREAHQSADTDAERASIHHTLGAGPTQAAPGNHVHYDNTPLGGVIAWFFDTIPDNFLECLGQTINQADYPEFFSARGIVAATYTLPDISDRYVKGHSSGGSAVGTLGGNALHQVTLTSTELPAHTHTGPSHTHTGPSHTHDIDHNHASATTSSDGSHDHALEHSAPETAGGNYPQRGNGGGSVTSRLPISTDGGHTHTLDLPALGTTASGSGGTGATGAAGTGATGSTGSGSAFNIEPRNIIGAMIMRVS